MAWRLPYAWMIAHITERYMSALNKLNKVLAKDAQLQ